MDKYNEKIINAVKCCTLRVDASECGKCGYSCYQNCIDTMLSDLEAALRRPLQKPLTLEETCSSKEPCVYIEHKVPRYIYAAQISDSEFDNLYNVYTIGKSQPCIIKIADYKKTWRCWATKPSEEEREAAKWEEL